VKFLDELVVVLGEVSSRGFSFSRCVLVTVNAQHEHKTNFSHDITTNKLSKLVDIHV
jgi:hypothetical protein